MGVRKRGREVIYQHQDEEDPKEDAPNGNTHRGTLRGTYQREYQETSDEDDRRPMKGPYNIEDEMLNKWTTGDMEKRAITTDRHDPSKWGALREEDKVFGLFHPWFPPSLSPPRKRGRFERRSDSRDRTRRKRDAQEQEVGRSRQPRGPTPESYRPHRRGSDGTFPKGE